MARRRTPRVSPRCQALLLCERVILNAETLRNSVIEILDRIYVTSLPITVGSMVAYAQLVGGIGGYEFRFEIHDLNADQIAATTEANVIEFDDAEEPVTLTASFPAVEFTGPGPHDLVAFADDRDVARFTFRVIPHPDEGVDDGAQDDEES